MPTEGVGEGKARPSALDHDCGLPHNCRQIRAFEAALRASEAALASVQESNVIACKQLGSAEAALAEARAQSEQRLKVIDGQAESLRVVKDQRDAARRETQAIRKLYNGVHDNLLRANLALELSRAEATKAEKVIAALRKYVRHGEAFDFPAPPELTEPLAEYDAAIRAPQPPEPEETARCPRGPHPGPCVPSSPPPPSACLTGGLQGKTCREVFTQREMWCVSCQAPPPSEEPSPRCGRCELQKIGLPTPGYPHAAGCVNAVPSPEPTREEPR